MQAAPVVLAINGLLQAGMTHEGPEVIHPPHSVLTGPM